MRPAMSTLLFLTRLRKQEKGSAALLAVILMIRQQRHYQFATSLWCSLQASHSFWQTIGLGKWYALNQKGGTILCCLHLEVAEVGKNVGEEDRSLPSSDWMCCTEAHWKKKQKPHSWCFPIQFTVKSPDCLSIRSTAKGAPSYIIDAHDALHSEPVKIETENGWLIHYSASP